MGTCFIDNFFLLQRIPIWLIILNFYAIENLAISLYGQKNVDIPYQFHTRHFTSYFLSNKLSQFLLKWCGKHALFMIALIYKTFQFQKVSPITAKKKKTQKLIPLKRCNQIFVEKQNMTWNSVWRSLHFAVMNILWKIPQLLFSKTPADIQHMKLWFWESTLFFKVCNVHIIGLNSTSSFTPLLINYKMLWRSTAASLQPYWQLRNYESATFHCSASSYPF